MKKYISPEIVVVELQAKNTILQASLPVNAGDGEYVITTGDEILTKSVISDKHVWDDEW